jgi:hypothetical protein
MGDELPVLVRVGPEPGMQRAVYVGVRPPRLPAPEKATAIDAFEGSAVAFTDVGSVGVGALAKRIWIPPSWPFCPDAFGWEEHVFGDAPPTFWSYPPRPDAPQVSPDNGPGLLACPPSCVAALEEQGYQYPSWWPAPPPAVSPVFVLELPPAAPAFSGAPLEPFDPPEPPAPMVNATLAAVCPLWDAKRPASPDTAHA